MEENEDLTSNLQDVTNNRPQIPLIGLSGQHRFGPPPEWTGPPPLNCCEVFVSKLPKEVYEDEVVHMFAKSGQIYETRLMMDYSGPNRGYAIVNYTSRSDAFCALRQLHGLEIRPGKYITVSMTNKRLIVGNIPRWKTKYEVYNELSKWVYGIYDVIIYKDCYDRRLNRGFAILKFASPGEAAVARLALVPFCMTLWDHEVIVEWAEPEPDPHDKHMKNVKTLYVRYFLLATTADQIKNEFEKATKTKIKYVIKKHDYAFLHFYDHNQAMLAMKTLESVEIDGCTIEVRWANPEDRKQSRIRKQKVVYEQHLEKIGSANWPHKKDLCIGTSYMKPTCTFTTDISCVFPKNVTVSVLRITHWLELRLIQCARDTFVQLQYTRHTQTLTMPLSPWQTYPKYVHRIGIVLWIGRVNYPQDGKPLIAVPRPIGFRPCASCSQHQV